MKALVAAIMMIALTSPTFAQPKKCVTVDQLAKEVAGDGITVKTYVGDDLKALSAQIEKRAHLAPPDGLDGAVIATMKGSKVAAVAQAFKGCIRRVFPMPAELFAPEDDGSI